MGPCHVLLDQRSADYRRIPKLEARRGNSVIVAPTYEWLVTVLSVRDIDACIHVHIVKVEINPERQIITLYI